MWIEDGRPMLRDVPRLLPQAETLAAQQQWQAAAGLAARIWSAGPADRHTLEVLAGIFLDSGQVSLAAAVIDRLHQVAGDDGYSLFLAAKLALMDGRWEDAHEKARRAVESGGLTRWQQVLVHNLLARLWIACGQSDRAAPEYQLACQYSDGLVRAENYSNYLLNLHYQTDLAADILYASRGYGELFRDLKPYSHDAHKQHKRLRIGYISPDFRAHVAAVFARVFLEHYDSAVFKVYVYANHQEDAISRRLAGKVTVWRNIYDRTAAEAAAQIYADEIDILVDLAGHTAHNCLPVLAYRPAPVQLSGIGYFATTGLDAVDYFLVDADTAPPGLCDGDFTEKLLRLPLTHLCYQPFREEPLPVYDYAARRGSVVFGCLNNFAKVTDELLLLWREILLRVPRSRLFLQAKVFSHPCSRDLALNRILRAGIPEKKLIIGTYGPDYLKAYQQIDIALDTYPYPGGGTTCDALYMGIPVISRYGQSHHTRFGYSILRKVGLEGCCAISAEEYIDKAVALARRPQELRDLHLILRRRLQQSPLMDTGEYMMAVERKYGEIWQAYLAKIGLQPAETAIRGIWSQMTVDLEARHWADTIWGAFWLRSMGKCPSSASIVTGFAYLQVQDYDRAAVWLEEAQQADPEHDAEICLLLSEARQGRVDYMGAYQIVVQAESCLAASTSTIARSFRLQVESTRASRALAVGLTAEAAEAYRLSAGLTDNPVERCNMYSSYLLSLQHLEMSSAAMFEEHLRYGSLLPTICPYTEFKALHKGGDKLRIGYLSADFRQHVMAAFYDAMIRDYDHQQFTIILYSMSPVRDAVTEDLVGLADDWCDLSTLSWPEAAARIYADAIDILVDLGGHSAASGLPLLAWHPAPVQVSGLGYMFSTGLASVDYFLTDEQVDPPGLHETYFTEKLLYLPSQFCYHPVAGLPAPVAAPCISQGHVTFGVFNHYRKITDRMLQAWRQIIERVPGARLFCKSQVLISQSVVDAAWQRFRDAGLPMDRVDFAPADTGYMQAYLAVDIALDTYPYPGGGTTCDALYMGVPVISLYGERRGSRFGLDILSQIGMQELAADTLDTYIEKAVSLAQEKKVLSWLHQQLRQKMLTSPLMDSQGYMRHLEREYLRIFKKFQQESNSGKI